MVKTDPQGRGVRTQAAVTPRSGKPVTAHEGGKEKASNSTGLFLGPTYWER